MGRKFLNTKRLTPREMEIIKLKSLGFLDKEVALSLGIKYCTVRQHLSRISWKLNASSTLEAIMIIVSQGMLKEMKKC